MLSNICYVFTMFSLVMAIVMERRGNNEDLKDFLCFAMLLFLVGLWHGIVEHEHDPLKEIKEKKN